MKFKRHAHKSGDRVVPAELSAKVEQALAEVPTVLKKRSATAARKEILQRLSKHGWSSKVRISAKRGLTLTAKLGNTALCLQTGNMARFYADLLKLQAQFLDGKITAAIYILPCREAAVQMGENLAHFERLTSEVTSMFSKVITVPLLVYGFYNNSVDGGK